MNEEPKYKIFNGTSYHEITPDAVVQILNRFEHGQNRLRIYYGNGDTGQDWMEDVNSSGGEEGYIGRSTGINKIPLLIPNARSTGGPAILDDCIVKIEYANKKDGGILYQHPRYHRKGIINE